MPVSEAKKARQGDRRAIEEGVEARSLFVKLEERSVDEFDVQPNGVSSTLGAKREHSADVGPTGGSDASSAFPEGEPCGDDNDAPELIHRRCRQLLAKPGRTRA